MLYGEAVVAACAEAGTDYLDLTGEPEFINTTFVRHHRSAERSGARLVHSAGFDSVPHDVGAYFALLQLPEDVPVRISGYVRASASISGGTFYSALTGFARPRANASAARSRRAVEERRSGSRQARSVTGRPHRDPVNGGWAVPLPTIDPQVVARSARAVPRYGPDFAYSHYASIPHLLTAVGGVAGVGGLVLAAQIPPARRVLMSRLAPGDGPLNRSVRAAGSRSASPARAMVGASAPGSPAAIPAMTRRPRCWPRARSVSPSTIFPRRSGR